MNIYVKPSFDVAAYLDHVKATRNRLMTPANAFRAKKPDDVALTVVNIAAEPPLWKRTAIEFDEHTKNWQFHRTMTKGRRYDDYIRRRCAELFVSYIEIVSPSAMRSLTGPRQLIMYELKTQFGLSYDHIGRLFGRDHTTVISAVKRITGLTGEAMPEKSNHLHQILTDLELHCSLQSAYERGMAIREMSVEFKISEKAIYTAAKIKNWTRNTRNRNGSSQPLQVNRAEIRADYEKGKLTLTRIADEHGISVRTVRRLAEANGWKRKGKE
jgi:nucleoside diphosphate kinase